MLLEELELPIGHIKGVGKETYKAFIDLNIGLIRDLLLYFPFRYEDRKTIYSLNQIVESVFATYIVEVKAHSHVLTRKEKLLKVLVADSTGEAELLCYGRAFLATQLSIGTKLYLFANFTYRYGVFQASAFEFELYSDTPKNFLRLQPVYGLTAKLTQHRVIQSVLAGFDLIPGQIDSIVPVEFFNRENLWNSKKKSLMAVHFPNSPEELEAARRSLAFEELFIFQIKKEYHIRTSQQNVRLPREIRGSLAQQLIDSLPFPLTGDQHKVLAEIAYDLQQSYAMRRLLQADVGAGKTLVALISAMNVISAGEQVALLAPTELLARQHAQTAQRLLAPLGLEVSFLSGNIRMKGRLEILNRLKQGEIHLIVGTHALFSDDVIYARLGYVIIDEQHRFGVLQRNKMYQKAPVVDLLLMSATPIPQTLQMSYLGGMEISSIRELPSGRQVVKTHLVQCGNEARVYDVILSALSKGRQAYFVYPLIDQHEQDERRALIHMYETLKDGVFAGFSTGIIHSRLDEESKRQTMDLFVQGEIQVLFSTSVIEVGVDVPNASLMIIYNAERFGLAALHQLRGRIGRGSEQGRCFLVYHNELSELAKERLKIMYEQHDGFIIADQDLLLRGAGDIGGIKQSGFMRFRLANLSEDEDLWIQAEYYAKEWLDRAGVEESSLYQQLSQESWYV
ncbi:ATP-dependent DNA helicase RecG [Entomospira nematocerorum]|uniref:ATP-dependent DNA helicase RecG n=1 Tax=Entomospira nematocerorum TaxID=2719987 RepID=A0A968GCE4_9SPIO|nr:ATP-dependent DNA helicase RecG [Entomospira nematocera]NIZ47302.1 ATP-dependent DNA helicase RecG [Entomospira nematocera]WDI34156.1 ATP-dependent DNA helicase RecG [Entomospira nematocera]